MQVLLIFISGGFILAKRESWGRCLGEGPTAYCLMLSDCSCISRLVHHFAGLG